MAGTSLVLLLITAMLGVIGLLGNFRSTTTGRLTGRGYWLLGALVLCAAFGISIVARQRYLARMLTEKRRQDIEMRSRMSKELPPVRK
ncbi:MAG: hypothetical protein DMF56_09360 [Acidobacteria bacterium]|nr:MAG: hypothetical protein DMF56_09360 [Acidobacteriota bacterium]